MEVTVIKTLKTGVQRSRLPKQATIRTDTTSARVADVPMIDILRVGLTSPELSGTLGENVVETVK
jgi:hypothetical protein